MMDKIIAFILSIITAFSGTAMVNPVDGVLSVITGIPCSEESINDSFIDNIGQSDVNSEDGLTGFYNNLIMIFIKDNTGVYKKYRLFRDNGLRLLGWCCPANMYIASCGLKNFSQIEKLGEKLTAANDCVLGACPVPFTASLPDRTPSDPFDDEGKWTESRPSGGNWYLEAINAREAFNYSEYFSHIKLGVVDSGFDTEHKELSGKISFPNSREEKRNNKEYHGTFVAGLITAKENGEGVCGICQDSDLVCVDWQPSENQRWNTNLHIIFGFIRTVKAGAKVINFSVGTSASAKQNDTGYIIGNRYDGMLYSWIISLLLGKGYDFLAVQSAGNGDADGEAIPALLNGHFSAIDSSNAKSLSLKVSAADILDRIIIVGAAKNNKNSNSLSFASYSNYGDRVDIVAPGTSLYGLNVDGEYEYMSGTSASAPLVTAVAGLVWSINPTLSAAEVKKIVLENTDKTITDLRDNTVKYPFLNAKLAVEAALKTKYKMNTVRGTIEYDASLMPYDSVKITSGGKEKIITAPDGNINLLFENDNGTINVLGEYEECVFNPVDFDFSGGEKEIIITPEYKPDSEPFDLITE